jgi:hypothetical protein
MIMNNNPVILVRVLKGIGIDTKGRGYLLDGTPVKRSFYGGRICYRINKTVVGYRSLANSNPVKIEVNKINDCPF